MRLSAYNPGELRNVVYLLADVPARIQQLPVEFVRRQRTVQRVGLLQDLIFQLRKLRVGVGVVQVAKQLFEQLFRDLKVKNGTFHLSS